MLFINFLCLLYLMVLADSHTLSKSIDNDKRVDDIFESINDVDRPTIPKTRKDRQHNYNVYYTKDDAVLQGIKTTKPYFEVETATNKRSVKLTPKPTTDNAKRHKSPKRRVSSFWKKLRGKDKKKETEKLVSKGRSNHKKESYKIAYLTTKPFHGKTESKKKHINKLNLRQTEHKVSKRDASGLFSTRPYSNTPQGYKLQMGIAPQFDNMLKSKNSKIESVQLHTVVVATADNPVVSDNLHAQLDRINSNLDTLKEKYGHGRVASDNNLSATSKQANITTEFKYQDRSQIDRVLRAMKVEAVNMSSVTELSNDAAEATIDSNQRTSVSALNTLVSNNEIGNREKRTVAITGAYATNPEDTTINAHTESYYLEARSIKEDAITIAMNVEDMIQRELKNLYNKVKAVSRDFRKEVHTVKSTLKEGYEKFSCKLKCKTQPTTPKHKTCKLTPIVTHSSPPSRKSNSTILATTTTTTTTRPRVKKKEEDWVGDSFFTPEGKQPYDDYVMLTLYEQMLSKTHENNANKLLATPEYAIYTKNKREARRLSKRNPETLTDVKLTEVVRNIFDDGGTMPDYDYIDPAANVSSTGKTWVSSKTTANNYNRDNYDDLSGSVDYSSQGLKGTSPMPNEDYNAADANDYVTGSVSSATVAYNTVPSGNPASDSKFEGLSKKIFYNQYVDGYKHYLKFQQELKNQNFSNLIKYQAHRHHSVDDIGKFILNKIPPITTFHRRKRNVKISDDWNDNMDYQEITSKSDDSWFKKHFYMFIDNGPPKKYHTSETVELKPGSVDRKPYLTNTTPTKSEDFIKIDSKGVLRKTKNVQEICMDDLSKILDSIKVNQGSNNPLKKASPPETQKEDTFMDHYNARDNAINEDNSFIGRFLSVKRRHVTKKHPIMTLYFPTPNSMYADNQHGRFKRSNTKESFQNTLMADFMNKDIIEEKAATTATKQVFADAAHTRKRETNKYGYVDIDLVPRQTAVKLRDTTKKSMIKNFFKKFHFKTNKTKKHKPKRSAYYYYYSPSPRRVRFNPIKKLKNLFKNKERKEEMKDFVAKTTFDANNEDLSTTRDLEPPKLDKPVFNVDEMRKQIPNITDPYSIPLKNVQTTQKSVALHYKLDNKDQDLLSDYHLESSSTEALLSPTTTDEAIMITKPVDTKAKQDDTIASRMSPPTITPMPNEKDDTIESLMSPPTITPMPNEKDDTIESLMSPPTITPMPNEKDDTIESLMSPPTITPMPNEKDDTISSLMSPPTITPMPNEKDDTISSLMSPPTITPMPNEKDDKIASLMSPPTITPMPNEKDDTIASLMPPPTITTMPSPTIDTMPNQKEQPSNVMKVNIKTLSPIKSQTRFKESSLFTTDDLSILLEQKRKDYGKPSESLPTITSRYAHDASIKRKKDKHDYKEDVQHPLPVLPEELSIRSNLKRYMKFPIRQGWNEIGRDDSEADNIERDQLGFDSESMLQYLRDLVSSSTESSLKRKTAVNTLKKVHPRTYKRHKEGKGPYTDYFNDLLMWHNDILNLDSVPNPLWVKILKTLKTNSADYTTPDMKNLMMQWNEINDFLGNSAENSVTVPTGATGVKANEHVSGRALDNQLDYEEEGVVRSVAMNDNTIVKSKDVLIKGESKYFQYNKPVPHKSLYERPSRKFVKELNTLKNNDKAKEKVKIRRKGKDGLIKGESKYFQYNKPVPHKFLYERPSRKFVKELNTLKNNDQAKEKVKIKRKDLRSERLTPADIPAVTPILVDTTLMAYDDDVDLVVKELAVKEISPTKSSKRTGKKPPAAAKTEHNSVLKTNKAPEQYYTTPLPMKPQDFQKFLKDYQMDVEFVTAPLHDFPTLTHDSSTNKKYNKGSKQNIKNADPATTPKDWNIRITASTKETSVSITKGSKLSLNTAVPSNLKCITEKGGKIPKITTEQVKRNSKVVNNRILTSKNSYWGEDFSRYKRFHALKLTTNKKRAYYETKYYDRFKKKMKGKLFENKATEQKVIDRPDTKAITADPRIREVEITIINLDELDKMTTPKHFDSFDLPIKIDLRPFKDYSDDLNVAYTTLKSKMKAVTEKVKNKMQEITKDNVHYLHNELLYKDLFNEQTSSAPTKESLNTDLTKTTEYDAPLPVEYGHTVTSNNTWIDPFVRPPVWPNIFSKMQRGKNFDKPKRVHILSHHYKYDIIYDDTKKNGKKRVVGSPLELAPATSTAINRFRKRARTIFRKGWTTAAVRSREILGRSRHRRRVWGTDATHKKRKYFNFRGCKSKSTSGLAESTQHLSTPGNSSDVSIQKLKEEVTASAKKISLTRSIEPSTYIKDLEPVPTSTPGNFSDVSMPKLEEDVTALVENTGTISLARRVEPSIDRQTTDIEDLVSMLDMQDLGDINSDIDTEVTLAAIETEFVTGITIRDSVRGALVKTKAVTIPVTMAIPATTCTPVTTTANATTTIASPTVSPSPLSGSVTYNLTQLKKTTSSRKSSKDKGKQLGSGNRERRLFKFSSLLKGFMKNFTMTTKLVNVTTTPMKKTKRMCIKYVPDKGKSSATEKMNEKATETETPEKISGEKEGFVITHCSGPKTPKMTTPVVERSVTSPRLVDDPGALHYDEEQSYTLDGKQYHPLTTLVPAHQRQCQDVLGCAQGKQFPTLPEEPLYMEPKLYADQYYQEKTVMTIPHTIPPTIPPSYEDIDLAPHSDLKREVQRNTFTAKDVAALEVIVDLMRNTLNYEDSSKASDFYHGNNQHFTTTEVTNYNSNNSNSTNAIQVHIAIPFDFENGKKRSLSSMLDPVRVRKVFCAKMSSPVDLEYQVNSIEGTITPTSTVPSANTCRNCSVIGARSSSGLIGVCDCCSTTDVDNLTPGMYLLVDKPKNGFALKPLLGKFHVSYVKTRQVSSETTTSMTEAKPTDSGHETTSLKSLAKVTLSKDFVSLINEHLSQLNDNRSIVSKDVDSDNARFARSVWFRKLQEKKTRRKKGAQIFIVKRRIDWDKVKAYFGHDRVCNCKCKSNTAMCRACAASDAVIDELIFEFDNIGRYMADHCTEIQTFFWMNPTGGQKLKDSVSKIDKSLADYCKRVKGKCQGRLCKTFSTYIDKRNFIKMEKIKKVEDISCLLNDLDTLASDLNMMVTLNACYNDKLKGNGEKFIGQVNKCINNKSWKKRSYPTTSQTPMVKQVYSLDNINVNIICNPETPSTPDELMMAATIASQTSSTKFDESMNNHLLNIDHEDNKYKKRKGFIYFFPRKKTKSKLLSYFDINKKVKRQVDNQASMPLISDGGGAFWYDYLKAGTNEPRLARNGSLHQKLEKLDSINDAPTILGDVVQRAVTAGHVLNLTATTEHNNLRINTIYETVHTRPERNSRETETTTDSLSQNIKQMLQLFGSLEEVESMNNNATSNPTTNFPTDTSILRKVSKGKENKISFVHKVKQKVDEALAKNRTKSLNTLKKKNQKMKPALVKETTHHVSTKEHTIKAVNQHAKTTNAVSEGSTNNRSTTVRLDAKTIASNNTDMSSTVVIKGIAPESDKKSISTPVDNKTTMKSGLKNMIKAVTEMFTKKQPQTKHTPEKTSKISTTTELTPIQTDLKDVVSSSIIDIDYDVNEITQNTSENPTILIIYDSKVSRSSLSDSKKENYKNLLLSIIQFETNNLNDEWSQVAYGGDHKGETDLKRNAPRTPKFESISTIILKPTSMPETASSEGNTHLLLKTHNATKTPVSLLDKIAKKIGIKVVNPKKVEKKASIRESRRNRNRANCIRNRKLRMGTCQKTPAPVINKEACHTRRTTQPAQICDIKATFKHIQNLQSSVPPKTFENLMKNVTCYKYRNADASFIIPYKKRGKTWDWIRNKRSLKHFHNKFKDDHDFDDETFVVGFEDDFTDIFERFVKGDNGIYQIVQRNKRKVNLETLERSLRNIPTLKPTEDELNVMVGDSVILDCGINAPVRTCDGKFHWKTDRRGMMEQDNVEVDGLTVAIHKVEPRNSGTYTCSLDHTVQKNVKLNVMTVPAFDVVFLPVYKTEENCSYDDLMAIQKLGSLMSNKTHCGKVCSVRIDEPVCQKDRSTNTTMLRATAVISMTARPVNCSLQCKRNIVSSLAMLSAANAAVLSSIFVEVSREGICETLTPLKTCVRPVVTHTLRKKDTNGHKEYHQLSSRMSPGKVDVVVICPAGYYLVNKYKLCSSCPTNTSSRAGDNTCRPCPRGTHADPGAATCHVVRTLHHRSGGGTLPAATWWLAAAYYLAARPVYFSP